MCRPYLQDGEHRQGNEEIDPKRDGEGREERLERQQLLQRRRGMVRNAVTSACMTGTGSLTLDREPSTGEYSLRASGGKNA